MNFLVLEFLKSKNIKLFHGSPVSGLNEIKVSLNKSKHVDDKINRIYASSLIDVAAAFAFDWDDSMNVSFGQINDGPLILKIPSKYRKLLNNTCSIYVVDPMRFIRTENIFLEEYCSYFDTKILSEQKFKTVLDAFNFTHLNYKFI